jgi:hypothetical protein
MDKEAAMSKYIPYGLGVLVGLLLVVSIAAASSSLDGTQAEPETFEAGGRTCVFYRGQLDCDCPCGKEPCGASGTTLSGTRVVTVPQVITVTVIDRGAGNLTLDPEAPPGATDSLQPGDEEDAIFPVPSASEDRDPDRDRNPANDRERCNQGVGNGSEGCSPGQSDNTVNPDHPHGPNDEGPDTAPGSPGRQGGGNIQPGSSRDPNKGNDK